MSLPRISRAATLDTTKGFAGFVELIVGLLESIIYFIFAIAVIVFLWGVIKYWIIGGGDSDTVKEGRDFVFSGIIGMVVMFTMWGLVRLLQNTFFGG